MEINLRKLENLDAERILSFLEEEGFRRWLGKLPNPYKIEDAKNFITESKQNFGSTSYIFAIAEIERDELVGSIAIKSIDNETKIGEIGYWVGTPFWNMGIASKALFLLSVFAKKDLGLKGLFAFVAASNSSSVKVLEKNNFKRDLGFFGSFPEVHGDEKILRYVKLF